ncbi:MAG TPA: dihydrofolate reductase family protein [Thermoleophilaceae bacterium]|nr:dihydrofolate reductase family protein [Thermoleophilaceae bacterium]
MAKLKFDISMSLDGFIAGPDPGSDQPLGVGGDRLHKWVYGLKSWRESHGEEGGATGADADIVEESLRNVGAAVMGRQMFGGGDGPWGDDPWEGWWGDDPPFHMPVFVLTHHPREVLTKQGGTTFTFVTDGIEAALEQAQAAAEGKDVAISGGANVAQQYLKAGLLDEFQVHVSPVLLGAGTRLFDDLGSRPPELEVTRVVESPAVTHLTYRVVK